MNIKKILSLVLCALIPVCILCGCEDDGDIAMEDLPYGSTMRQLKDTPITICVDGRFITDEEMRMVADYFYAVQTRDVELFKKTQNPDYVSYLEKNSDQNLEDFLTNISMEDENALGENFEYSYIEAVGCGGRNSDSQINDIIELMNTIYEENGREKSFDDTIKDEKFLTLSLTANSEGKTYNHDDLIIYVFTCEDGIYIFD